MKIKRKGTYEFDVQLHQNHSSLVIQRAVSAHFVEGKDIPTFIYEHEDKWDFLLRTKVPKNSYLEHGSERVQNVSRYYVSTDGEALTKVMPPTDKLILKWNTVAHWKHVDSGKHVNAAKAPSGKYQQCVKPSDVPPDRRMSIQKGWLVTVCNSMTGVTFSNLNYDYYITEAKKLVEELK